MSATTGAGPDDDLIAGEGWLFFSGVILGLAGIMRIFDSIWAFRYKGALPDNLQDGTLGSDIKSYAWLWLVVGIVLIVSSVMVITGSQFARWIGIIGATVGGVSAMWWMPYYPVWSLVYVTVAFLVIYGLAMYGGSQGMTTIDETGAIDWLLLEAPHRDTSGRLVGPLLDLVNKKLIRILDVMIIVKRGEDDFDGLSTQDLRVDVVGDLGELAGASSGLLDEHDAAEAVKLMAPSGIGLFIVYENLWSLPFAIAAREAGGQLLAHGHIPTQAIVAALDALES